MKKYLIIMIAAAFSMVGAFSAAASACDAPREVREVTIASIKAFK